MDVAWIIERGGYVTREQVEETGFGRDGSRKRRLGRSARGIGGFGLLGNLGIIGNPC